MARHILLLAVLFLFAPMLARAFPTSPDQREKALRVLASEMKRLDGGALVVRGRNRPESWNDTVNGLAAAARAADSPEKFARAFLRLDQTYPNLHSNADPSPILRGAPPRELRPSIRFSSDWRGWNDVTYRIHAVNSWSGTEEDKPLPGDEVIAINSHPIDHWKNESLIFCKFPLRNQCEAELPSALQQGLLSWAHPEPLHYTLRRGDRAWSVSVPMEPKPPTQATQPDRMHCANFPDRYPGFHLSWSGERACVYESADGETAVLRITSFQYKKLPSTTTIRSTRQEVQAMRLWWEGESGKWRHLVVDVIDNTGGQQPTPYYQLLLGQPFQEQYVRFRKSGELLDDRLRMGSAGIFWGSEGHERWFQRFVRSPGWDAVPMGEFLPPVPQFCARAEGCESALFQPYGEGFQERISVLMNQWCISSCDGFVWQMKSKRNARLFGQPQAADSAYSRLAIHMIPAPEGFRTEVTSLDSEAPAGTLISQTVVVSQSTDSLGNNIDGLPMPLDAFVPSTPDNEENWHHSVLERALKN